jgi:hypothetical protein
VLPPLQWKESLQSRKPLFIALKAEAVEKLGEVISFLSDAAFDYVRENVRQRLPPLARISQER